MAVPSPGPEQRPEARGSWRDFDVLHATREVVSAVEVPDALVAELARWRREAGKYIGRVARTRGTPLQFGREC